MVTCNSYLSQTTAVHDHTSVSQYKIDNFSSTNSTAIMGNPGDHIISSFVFITNFKEYSYKIVIIHMAAVTVVALAQ